MDGLSRSNTRRRWAVGKSALALACLVMMSCARARSPAGGLTSSDPPPPGRLIDIGGYRLQINCTGKGKPTAILLAGAGDFSFDWALVQPELSRSMRVCSYDRAGAAWSDLGPTPRTMRQEVYELRRLLQQAGVRGPYVLVGHSYGGLLARVYAESYPRDVAGMVLVDPTHEDTQLMFQGKVGRVRESAQRRSVPPVQSMRSSPPLPPTEADLQQEKLNRQLFGAPVISPPFDRLPADAQALRLWALNHPKLSAATDDYWAEELQQIHVARQANPRPLGSMPLIVLAGGRGEGPPEGINSETWKQLGDEKRAQKADLANLSTQGQLVVDASSGHHVQLDNPALVIDAVSKVVTMLQRMSSVGP